MRDYQQVFATNLLSVVSPLSPPTNIFLQHKITILIFETFGKRNNERDWKHRRGHKDANGSSNFEPQRKPMGPRKNIEAHFES